MPYLNIAFDHVSKAWEQAEFDDRHVHDLSKEEQLEYGKRAATTHAPDMLPWGTVCRNCHASYPCWLAMWGLGLLKHLGWDLAQLKELIDRVNTGGKP